MKLLSLKRLSWGILGVGIAFFLLCPLYFHGWHSYSPSTIPNALLGLGFFGLPYLLAGGAVALTRHFVPAYVALLGCVALVAYGAVTSDQLWRDDSLYSSGDSTFAGVGFMSLWSVQMLGCGVLLYFMGGAWLVSWSIHRRQQPNHALQRTEAGDSVSSTL